MKQFKNLVLLFVFAFVAVLSLTSCMTSSTTSIAIQEMPKTTFELDEDVDGVLLQLKITDNGTHFVALSYKDGKVETENPVFQGQILLTGFSTKTVGSFTAVVTFKGASSYFDYEVINPESGFSGGNGSVNNPYQITEAAQLALISNHLDAHYKLMNDIDLSEVKSEDLPVLDPEVTSDEKVIIKGSFTGSFDGNGKKLYNITDNYLLFERTIDAELKNLDIYLNTTYFVIVGECSGDVTFENVNTYGVATKASNNYGVYTLYATNVNLEFIDCYNEVQIFSTTYVAGFVGYVWIQSGDIIISFNKCEFAGYIEGTNISAFICNSSSGDRKPYTVKFEETKITGSLIGMDAVNAVLAWESDKLICETLPNSQKAQLVKKDTYEFKDLAYFDEDGYLVLNKADTDKGIATVAVVVEAYADVIFYVDKDGNKVEGTILQRLVKEITLTGKTQTTEFVNKGTVLETKQKVEGKGVFYIGEQGYICNSANQSDHTYTDIGDASLRIVCYDENGILLGSSIVKLPYTK